MSCPPRSVPEVLRFPELEAEGWLVHGFIGRVPGVAVDAGREEVVARFAPAHRAVANASGFAGWPIVFAEQVHGIEVARVGVADAARPVTGVDGLVTDTAGLCLGILVADCCAVYLADPVRRAIGLVHAGCRGTLAGILPAAIDRMAAEFGTKASDLTVVLGPCIRPPLYEVDFAAELRRQAAELGVGRLGDCGLCTGSDLGRWYSYRVEKGRTGRMLALMGIRPEAQAVVRRG